MSIRERTGEFSSLRVLGYSQQEIFRLLVGENSLLAAAGLFLGLPVGWGLVKLMELNFTTDLYTLTEPVSLTSLLLALASTLLFVLLAQLITYRRIPADGFYSGADDPHQLERRTGGNHHEQKIKVYPGQRRRHRPRHRRSGSAYPGASR